MKILEYTAHAGMGIIFRAKTFIIEGKENIYIISPCNLDSSIRNELEKSPKRLHFIAPNNVHNIHLSKVKEYFPKASFYGPKRSMKQSGVSLKDITELPKDDLKTVFIDGNKAISETCFFIKETNELIVTDLIFNMHHEMNFPTKLMMKVVGTYHKVGTSRLFKMAINDKEAFKKSLDELLDLEPKKIFVNHGEPLNLEEFQQHLKSLSI